MFRRLLIPTLIVISAIFSVYFFFPSNSGDTVDAETSWQFGENGVCEQEAVLLATNKEVRSDIDGKIISRLVKGQPVYLCDVSNEFRRIVFPQNGTPVDCSMRETDLCLSGYIEMPIEFDYAG